MNKRKLVLIGLATFLIFIVATPAYANYESKTSISTSTRLYAPAILGTVTMYQLANQS